MASLDRFSPVARAWFEATFEAPTAAQEQGWEAISSGQHTLILAPTGSGKTLAAFLWALDRLMTAGPTRVLYVSPLKALTYDVERNLRAPLTGMSLEAERRGLPAPAVRVATRTGDTPAADRRDIARHPPDILITTPESLYLMLTSAARDVLAAVEYVIVDEIHSVAGTKRGAHLALSLERLERLTAKPPQRIGLSATQRPLDEIARFLGGRDATTGDRRPVTVVDAGVRKPLDLEVIVPVEDMAELGRPIDNGEFLSGPAAGDPEVRHSIWPAIHPVLLELIDSHQSTLVFVNSRRLAERLANRLNDLARVRGGNAADNADLVRAHHGSVAREQRLEIEDALKAGKLPALVATSSLELGIDMGAIDLVVQVESPTSVASGLQRIGRAGHRVGEPSKGRIFPKFRGDLVEAAVVVSRMKAGLIEETRIPKNPIDVLAQQIVAMVAIEDLTVDEVAHVVRGAEPFAECTGPVLEGVLDMLAGRYPSDEFSELRPRIVWDRVEGTLRARAGARMLAVVSGGTIPDRGLFGVFTPEGGRVGEIDEEFVYESRPGETFVLGATTWRIQDITRDRVVVTPAPGEPGKMPFWHGDGVGRPAELGKAIGAFLREVDGWTDERLAEECELDPLALRNLRSYLAEERAVTGALPTDRQIVVERFRDELGDWRVCVLSPMGGRVHAPWALAVEAKIRSRLGLEVQTMWSDEGLVVRLPEADEGPPVDSILLDPEEIEELVVGELANSALFAARFRENAARALLLPRRRPGSRTPLWQQRQRAADLLGVASKHGSFPILLETYRECLRDVFDLPALIELMGAIRSRTTRVVSVETARPSPFAQSLAFAYVASFLYEGDAPLAERRAQALTLDRGLLAELLGSEELRELISSEALADLEDDLQHLDEDRWARDADEAHDLLRRLGDLTAAELRARSVDDFAGWLLADRRAVEVRIGGEIRLIAAEDAGRYRDGLGVQPPPGLPEAFLEPVDDPLGSLLGRWARTHGPFLTEEPATRFGLPAPAVEAVLHRRLDAGVLLRGEFKPGGTEREWCDPDVLRRLRQRSLAALRREVEPAETEALARFLPAWHGIGTVAPGSVPERHPGSVPERHPGSVSERHPGSVPERHPGSVPERHHSLDRLVEAIAQLQGVPIPASVLERDVLAARVADYSPRLLDELAAAGQVVWMGAGPLGRDDGKVLLFLRDEAAALRPLASAGDDRPADPEHDRIREILARRGACFFSDLRGPDDRASLDALWDLVWAGEVTNDSFAALRAFTGTAGRATGSARRRTARPNLGSLTVLGPPRAQGRWSLVDADLPVDEVTATHHASALAAALLERHGVLTREAVRGEGHPGGYAAVYPVLRALEDAGRVRRGYFVAGLGGAQFALPGAVDRLRARPQPPQAATPLVLAATDPANAYGIALPWPVPDSVPERNAGSVPERNAGSVPERNAGSVPERNAGSVPERYGRPRRVAGAYVVLLDGVASLYLERGGRGLVSLRPLDGTWEEAAVGALDQLVATGRLRRLALERYDQALDPVLRAAGFVPSPKGLVRYA